MTKRVASTSARMKTQKPDEFPNLADMPSVWRLDNNHAAKPQLSMENARIIPDFPDYAIEPDGTLWRITPSCLDGRWGEVPRKVSRLRFGSKNRRHEGYKISTPPGVGGAPHRCKTALSLLKLAYPDGGWTYVDVAYDHTLPGNPPVPQDES